MSNERTETVLRDRLRVASLWLFLLSPLGLDALLNPASRSSLADGLFIFNLTTSVLWVVTLHAWVRRPFVLHLALLPLYVTTAIDLFLVWTFRARLSSGYVTIALTDYTEAGELLSAYSRSVALVTAALLVVYVPGLIALRRTRRPRRPIVGAVAALLLVAIYGAAIGRGLQGGGATPERVLLDVAGKEMGAPFGAIAQTGLALHLHLASNELRKKRSHFVFNASKAPSPQGEIYVWVIGESSRPQNWSLFGYGRQTNPVLGAVSGIRTLPNLLTTAPHTSVAVPSMLSLSPITDWSAITSRKSILGAFSEVGFKTYWLSAQEADSWGGLIPQIAGEAKRRRYFDRAQDGAMLGEYRSILDAASKGDKILIVLHTKGSHFEYTRRYPSDFAKFATANGSRRDQLVDGYDNSILYTDWFLGEVIGSLSKTGFQSALLYASDHGENLLDDSRQLFGHALGTEYDLPTAALFWLSDSIRQAHPEQAQALERNGTARISLSNLPHSMLDIAGISAQGFDPTLSLFNAKFAPQSRWYTVRGDLHQEGTR